MANPTEELRKLLDERGVVYREIRDKDKYVATVFRATHGMEFIALDGTSYADDGKLYINSAYLTPNEIIDVTLSDSLVARRVFDDADAHEHCSLCSSRLRKKDMYCWNCGAKLVD